MVSNISWVILACCIAISTAFPALVPVGSDDGLFRGGFFQGDIAGVDPYELNDRSATVKLTELWPEGIVYYKIDRSLDRNAVAIRQAMDEYENKTCIQFREATPETIDYVNILYLNGCWSQPGHRGGKQEVSLGGGCHDMGTMIHELGHVLGFFHEQSRSDRDDYIEIIWENIERGQEIQFIKMKDYDNNLLDEKFDYTSIMLYDETTFSKDGVSPTVRVLEPGVVIGKVHNKVSLSEVDVRKINKLYECNGIKRPIAARAPDIVCNFTNDDCGIQNEYGSPSFVRQSLSLGDRSNRDVFVVDASTSSKALVGLVTPFWHLYDQPEGCFSFDYYLNGNGVYSMDFYKNNDKIFEIKDKADKWIHHDEPVYQKDGEVAFHFGGSIYFREHLPGFIAVDNVAFRLSPCPKLN